MSSIALDQQRSDKRTGAIATVLFHVLLAILFLFMGLQQPNPLPKDEMIELVMEDMGGGGGSIAAATPGTPQPTPSSAPAAAQPEEVATQDDSPVEQPKPVKPDRPKPTPTTPAPPKPNPSALFTPSTTQPSTQTGPPGGSVAPGSTSSTGLGNFNTPGMFGKLAGRGLGTVPAFIKENEERGSVYVEITVSPEGKVIKAEPMIKTGTDYTTTTSPRLWSLAKRNALLLTFTPDPNANRDQVGFVVFKFEL